MKSGISLVDMAKEIQRQADLKADYVLDTRSLRLEPFDSKLYLNAYDQSGVPALEPLEVNSIAHRQIGTHLKIPAAYYDKMLEKYPQLLAQNVNAWFQREPSVRMVRTIEGTARAFLSNRYRRIDNLDIAGIVLPVLQDMEGMHFESCQLTESRMYIKVVNTRLEAEVVPGDIVQSGIIISNSEVGLGSVNIQPLVYRLVCSNGTVLPCKCFLLGWYLLRRRTTPMDEQQHNAIELPKGLYEPVLRQPMELDFLLGQELSLCFHDLDGSHVFKTCYGDICKAVNALRDYARLLEMACEQWDLTGFHRALYEYHAEKMREIAGKFQAGIGYDYDAAMEKCRRKKKRKKKEDDFGEDALVLAFKRTKQPAEQMKEADIDVDDSPWEEDEDEQESDD